MTPLCNFNLPEFAPLCSLAFAYNLQSHSLHFAKEHWVLTCKHSAGAEVCSCGAACSASSLPASPHNQPLTAQSKSLPGKDQLCLPGTPLPSKIHSIRKLPFSLQHEHLLMLSYCEHKREDGLDFVRGCKFLPEY